ncbi:TPA_asm: hypothetical protein G0D16_10350 [Salmonella bongori serovar 44:r:-]|uniref:Uncharacterized protein n=1 Tax=Salmonella bongori serovar 44:r:- TaxID=1967585 RepID=A0A702FIJ2_SALBN|nr:hypothetical protein [Salmonella bongori serovar 44:r:-]
MPIFNLLFLIEYKSEPYGFDAMTTCHFVIVDMARQVHLQTGIIIALKGQQLREAICTKSPYARGHWN